MENIKIFKPSKSSETQTSDTTKFSLYPILPNSKKLEEFRREYIRTLNGNVIYRILCTNPRWFYERGLYDVETILRKRFYEFAFIPYTEESRDFLQNYIQYGATDIKELKALRVYGENNYIYTNRDLDKRGRVYSVAPIIKINEDLYNLDMIRLREFSLITTDDLSAYSSFFTVGTDPYYEIEESRIEDLYRTGKITPSQYEQKIASYKREMKLVKNLRG